MQKLTLRSSVSLIAALLIWLATPAVAWQDSKPSAEEKSAAGQKVQQPDADKQAEKTENQSEEEREAKAEKAGSSDSPSESRTTPRRSVRRESALVRVSRSGSEFLRVFEPIVAHAVNATVEVTKGSQKLAMGAIVDPNGFVLTKHSELHNPISVTLSDGSSFPARVYGIHEETDLALLKIDNVDNRRFPTIRWSDIRDPEIGTWLATVSLEQRPLAVGVVGVRARRIRPPHGYMGVFLGVRNEQVIITEVQEKTPASVAGARAGDIILQVNDTTVTDIPKLQEIVRGHPPGDRIRMTVQRDDEKLVLNIKLANAETMNPNYQRSAQQNSMGSTLSLRRSDFPLAVQHDTALQNDQCGGPVVDIDGKVIGVNIARRGRVSSLMLPVSLVQPIVEELKSGKLAPALVNKERIEEINRSLEQILSTLSLGPAESKEMQTKLKELTAAEKVADKKLDEAKENWAKASKEKMRIELQLEEINKKLKAAQREKELLERELEKLVSGAR